MIINCIEPTQVVLHWGEEAYMGTRPVFGLESIKFTYGMKYNIRIEQKRRPHNEHVIIEKNYYLMIGENLLLNYY